MIDGAGHFARPRNITLSCHKKNPLLLLLLFCSNETYNSKVSLALYRRVDCRSKRKKKFTVSRDLPHKHNGILHVIHDVFESG